MIRERATHSSDGQRARACQLAAASDDPLLRAHASAVCIEVAAADDVRNEIERAKTDPAWAVRARLSTSMARRLANDATLAPIVSQSLLVLSGDSHPTVRQSAESAQSTLAPTGPISE